MPTPFDMIKKTAVSVIFVFLIQCVFLFCAYAESTLAAKYYVDAGKKEFKAKEYDLAVKEFRKALMADPQNEEALMYLRMLSYGGKGSRDREQDPVRKEQAKTKPKQITEKKAVKKQEPVEEIDAKDFEKSEPEIGRKIDDADRPGTDLSVEEIEAQIDHEEALALKALREEAARKEKAALEKTRKKTKKKSADFPVAKKAVKESAATSDMSEETPSLQDDMKSADFPVAKKAVKESAATSDMSEETLSSQDDFEKLVDEVLPPEDASIDADVESFAESTPQGREEALVNAIRKDAAKQEAQLKNTIAAKTAKKIEKIHKKFASKPIGENEKTVLRKFDDEEGGQGIPEEISLKESLAIEKVEDQAKKEESAGLKNIRSAAAKEEKAAIRRLRAQINKEEKLKPKVQLKSGDVVDDTYPLTKKDGSSSVDDSNVSGYVKEANEIVASKDEAAVLADIKSDLSKKEKDLEMKYAKKKALRVIEAEKKQGPLAQESQVDLNENEETFETGAQDEPLVDKNIPVSAPRSIKAQNVVLKKKLAQIVEMSQKDQELIKDLENNIQKQDEKVDVLEGDLREAKVSLESKVEMIQEKEAKLQALSQRIAAMESEVNSKQYEFKDKQIEYEKKLQAIEEEFGNYKSERANNEEELKEQLRILKEALAKKIAELNAVQEKLIFTENKLSESESRYAQTARQYEEVKKTLSDLEGRLSDLASVTSLQEDQVPIVEIDPNNLPPPKNQNEVLYQQWIKRHDKLVLKLKEKLLWAQDQIEFLGRYDIRLTDQKMAALKEELVAVKKQLGAKVPVGRSEEDFAVMESRLKDSQERLDMVEKILREKDEQIRDLEKQLNEVLSAF